MMVHAKKKKQAKPIIRHTIGWLIGFFQMNHQEIDANKAHTSGSHNEITDTVMLVVFKNV